MTFRAPILCVFLAFALNAFPQETGNWRAASKTAQAITGDIFFSDEKLSINFNTFTIAQIRELTPAEIAAGFDGATGGSGNLFRLSIPAEKKFLHKNSLCGGEETQWIATRVSGKTLQMELFSGGAMPVFTPEAISTTTNLCGTFTYSR